MRDMFRKIAAILLLQVAALAVAMTSSAAGEAEISRLQQLFSAPETADKLFSASFLAAVPADQVKAIIAQLTGAVGRPVTFSEDGHGYAVETATHVIPVQMSLDADGRIAGLLFQPPVALTASLDETFDKLASLAKVAAFVAETNGRAVVEQDADQPLAVGSAFKLGVLKVLRDDVAAGRRNWDDIVRIEPGDRSLPSGDMRLYPVGSPVTVYTLAAEMISKSDNTATDTLIRVVGADRAAGALGIDTLLTTRALFQLKADKALADTYAKASAGERAAILGKLTQRELPSISAASGPYQAEIEWMVPTRQLCRLALEVVESNVFTINPGPIRPGPWKRIAFKGGSELGVLNLTAALVGVDGRRHCLSVTLNNDKDIDEGAAAGLFARAASQLAAAK